MGIFLTTTVFNAVITTGISAINLSIASAEIKDNPRLSNIEKVDILAKPIIQILASLALLSILGTLAMGLFPTIITPQIFMLSTTFLTAFISITTLFLNVTDDHR